MRRLAPLLPILLLGPLMSGCATHQNMTLAPAVAPVVTAVDYPIDLAGGPAGLATGEAARLGGWLEAMHAGPGDRIGVPPGAAARDVAIVAARFGLMTEPAAPGGAGGPYGAVRVTLNRATASVAGCPDWSNEEGSTSSGSTSPNFGCADRANLAAMLADPRDLLRGRTGDGSDPRVSLRAIQMWRETKPTGAGGLKAESVGGGK